MTAAESAGTPAELRLIPGAFACTDTGNAERFIARHRNNVHYLPERKKWLLWNGSEWELDRGKEIQSWVKRVVRGIQVEADACDDMRERATIEKWAFKSEALGKRTAIEELVKSEPDVAIHVDALDTNPWLLNCANGTLDLRTCELHTARRSDLITKSTKRRYVKGYWHETWQQVLHNMTGGDTELSAYLKRVAGYSLTGFATEKKFFFLHGPRDSGKSSFINALLACMGTYARSTPFDTWLESRANAPNRDDLVALAGVRLVTSSEVAQHVHWNTPLVKQITGGDVVTAMAKFESQVEFLPSCTLIMAANDAPRARQDDDGFWGRMQRVPITHVVAPEARIKNFLDVLKSPEVAEAILAWAVEGCSEWQSKGIGTAAVVTVSTEQYRDENDWLGGFLEMYETAEGFSIPANIFREQYTKYCDDEGQRAEATKTLATKIAARMPGVRYIKRKGARLWDGIRRTDTQPVQGHLDLGEEEPQ